jgi:arginine-tRNA-protein transferase
MKKKDLLNPKSTDFCTLDYECSYLPNKKVRMYYKYTSESNKIFNTAVVQRGWRRFGNYYFYPLCNGCNECKSLRIDVENFKLTKSQRRVIKKNRYTRMYIQEPQLKDSYIDLYNKYHKWKAQKDGWKYRAISVGEYYENFVEGASDFGKEVIYIKDNKLVGVDLIDILEDGISAIYFFYDPDYAHLSLGIYSLLYQIYIAKEMNLKYIYLGYWVDGCKAFEYKPRFQPQEILDGFPSIDQEPEWKPFDLEEIRKKKTNTP